MSEFNAGWKAPRRSFVASMGQVFQTAFASVVRNTPLTIAAVACTAIALTFAGLSALVSAGVGDATERWRAGVETIVFIDPGTSDVLVEKIGEQLAENPAVAELVLVDQNAAYVEFAEMFELSPELVDNVTAAALPSSWRVVPVDGVPQEQVESIADVLRVGDAWTPGVYDVVYAADAVDGVVGVATWVRHGLLALAAVLILSACILSFAAARAGAWARQDELSVMRTVGAPRWMVRLPFAVEGALCGVAGGLVAAGTIFGLSLWADSAISAGGRSSGILEYLSVESGDVLTVAVCVVAAGAAIGTSGAAAAARRYAAAGVGVSVSLSERVAVYRSKKLRRDAGRVR